MTEQQFLEVTKWQKETFPKATSLSKAYHLKEEVMELIEDIESRSGSMRLEFADCFLLLFGSANNEGMTYKNICDCIEEKMKICTSRKWGEPDKNGVVKHISI